MAVQRDKVIASAEKLVAKGKIEPAIKEYEKLLDDNPNDVNTLNRIGDLWVRINRSDEAVKVFSKIAEHYSRDGFFLKAIAIFKKINKLDPSKLDIYAKLADLYAKQGLAMEAKSQYQVLADYYIKHGDPGNALAIYRKISELDPQSINVHVKLADLYSQNNQTGEALKQYDRVGRMLLKRGMLDEAQQVFRKALKIDPRNTELVDSLVTALLEGKDFENARQIVETALEANAESPRLLALLGKIQLGRGDTVGARATLERAIAADPEEATVREALADLYVKQNEPDRALEMVGPLVERALARGERTTAIDMLNRIVRVDPGHVGTLERLVAVYSRLNEETNILASMSSLAEAHVSKNRFEDAAKVLDKLIAREPQNAQHRNKLQFVRSQMGGLDTLPRTKTSPGMPAMEIEEPAPSFDMSDDSYSIDLDASPALELDLSMVPPEPVRAPAPPPPPPTHLMSAVERAAADLASDAGGGNDDLDFITEHLTEAEVFAKYGLAEKAAEHLRAVLERAPKNLTAHERLFRILLEEGENDAARTAAQAYVAILQESGDTATIDAVKNEFTLRGQTFTPAAAARAATPPPAAPVYAPEPATSIDFEEAPTELSFDLDAPAEELEFELEPPAMEVESPVEATPQAAEDEADFAPVLELAPDPVEELTAEELPVADELTFAEELPSADEFSTADQFAETNDFGVTNEFTPATDLGAPNDFAPNDAFASSNDFVHANDLGATNDFPPVDDLAFVDDTPTVDLFASRGAADTAGEPLLDIDEPTMEIDEPVLELAPESDAQAPGQYEPAAADPFFGTEGGGFGDEEVPVPGEELAEIDFYIEQELFDEARRKLDALMDRFPGNNDLETRRDRLEIAAATAAAGISSRPPVLSRDEIETELLSAIPDDDDDFGMPATIPAPAAATPAPAPAITASAVQEENLFADEENFFDLAAELESELAEEDEAISLSEEEQSLEEIFKEFKKGVEQQLDSEDYDTHYNLGIAYKEMGLIDEAIGEFQLASKDPKRAVECASMLGLCFLEKGMPQLAIKWYRKGLEMPEISEDEHIGLLYDLASAYQEVGDTDNAQRAFMEVYGMNSNYRDIVGRIKQLEDTQR